MAARQPNSRETGARNRCGRAVVRTALLAILVGNLVLPIAATRAQVAPSPAAKPVPGRAQPGYYPSTALPASWHLGPEALPAEAILHAIAAAERDASAETSVLFPFVAGCLLNWLGVIIAYQSEPWPPVTRLIAMPPGYAEIYSAVFRSKARGAQGRAAIVGCLLFPLIFAMLLASG